MWRITGGQRLVAAVNQCAAPIRRCVMMKAMNTFATASVAPVEYAVAVDRYLTESQLSPASRRVYRISLAGWAWPLVGKLAPAGRGRWRASPPIVPLALLEDQDASRRLADAVAYRTRYAETRTVNRE